MKVQGIIRGGIAKAVQWDCFAAAQIEVCQLNSSQVIKFKMCVCLRVLFYTLSHPHVKEKDTKIAIMVVAVVVMTVECLEKINESLGL